jgi:carbohydrate-binding DOMON domain-containing protein
MVIRGFGADLWRIRAESYNTRGDTVAAGAIHVEGAERESC